MMDYKVVVNRPGRRAEVYRGVTRARALALVDHWMMADTKSAVTVLRHRATPQRVG